MRHPRDVQVDDEPRSDRAVGASVTAVAIAVLIVAFLGVAIWAAYSRAPSAAEQRTGFSP